MIREPEGNAGKSAGKLGPRALLRSIERRLSKTSPVTDEKAHQAQQLVYDAWEAETHEAEEELIAHALELDETNVDALLQAMVYSGIDGEEEIELLRNIVAIGERNLGPRAFKEYADAFWGSVETRPYMRARERLAEALRVAGRLDDAIAEWEAMLELNPNDNQGVRYVLLASLLMLGKVEEARKLFEKYPQEFEFNAMFAWSRVLERFLSGDLPGSSAALAVARKQNPHVQAYVKGHRQAPRSQPEAYSLGSKEEAVCFAELLRAAWQKHPAALKWLEAQKAK